MITQDILCPDCTHSAVQVTSKDEVLQRISQFLAAKLPQVSETEVYDSLLKREKLGSTGVGMGIAIPHGRIPSAQHPVATLFVLETPIEFDAIDNQPVDIIFALVVPEDQPEAHLQTLAEVAQRFNNREYCRLLRQAQSDEDLYQLFIEYEDICNSSS